jgi:hypothetical protein
MERLEAPRGISNGTSLEARFVAGTNQDGRQELFAIGTDGHVWQVWQTAPNGGWSDFRDLGAPGPGLRRGDRITVGSNADGRQELFAMANDDAAWHVWQEFPNAGWSEWRTLDKPAARHLSDPLVKKNADGHLEVFAPGDGAFCNRWQESPNSSVWRHEGWNEKPRPRPDVGLTWLEGALNFTQHLEVVGLGDDGALWHAWQIDVKPNWSEWQTLGAPPQRSARRTGSPSARTMTVASRCSSSARTVRSGTCGRFAERASIHPDAVRVRQPEQHGEPPK